MANHDPIASMLTSLRNAAMARNRFVDLDLSQMRHAILKVLEKQGFLEHILVDEEKKRMRVFLRYDGREPLMQGLKRISKPGLRKYIGQTKIPKIYGGLGVVILSTSQGILDGETARERGVGGELLCYIW
ncbi:30S ribosomal protein S8 [Rhabdochlamydiaceae symbiont of Dictyostelium giganteum]|uniref:30S ribosomal protein S8 n=1 Tax=Rhabdochlamydiaceae symbiont of Dictyostelium giganteum TaxID=3342349 RepID=UPI003850B046